MDFKVRTTRRADQDIVEAVEYIALDSPLQAIRWLDKLDELLVSLANMPERFPKIPETIDDERTFRSVNHYSHRIVCTVDQSGKEVTSFASTTASANHSPTRISNPSKLRP